MADHTVGKRVKNQRDLRLKVGWQEVRVWVPTCNDAEEIKSLAAELRRKAEALHGLSNEVPTVSPETEKKIANAIALHGSDAYNHPDGAVLELMTDLANKNDLNAFSHAVVILARAKPIYAQSVIKRVPAKICNFLIKYRNISASSFEEWRKDQTTWKDELKKAVLSPGKFEQVVESMAKSITGKYEQ